VTLIYFSATWCGPCRRTAPLIEELAAEFSGRIKVAKVDVDQAPGLARRYGINSLPCLMLFKDGRSTETRIGQPPSKDYLKRWMQEHVPATLPTQPGTGMNTLPREQRSFASEVGELVPVDGMGIAGCKYALKTEGRVIWYVIEPSDVDLTPMSGRLISLTGTRMGRTASDVAVVQMRSASTVG
jgi:thioredoxin 1